MKLTPDSPEITAYALGEVSPEERAIIERAIAESPELRAEIASLRRLADTLETQLAAEHAPELDEARRSAIIEAAADPSKAVAAHPVSTGGGPLHWFSNLWTVLTRPALGFSLAGATALAIALALWTPWKVRDTGTVTDGPRYAANKKQVEQRQEFARDAKDSTPARPEAVSELKSVATGRTPAELADRIAPQKRADPAVNGPAEVLAKQSELTAAGVDQPRIVAGTPVSRSSAAASTRNLAAGNRLDHFGAAGQSAPSEPAPGKPEADKAKVEGEARGYQPVPALRFTEDFYSARTADKADDARWYFREQGQGSEVKLQTAVPPPAQDLVNGFGQSLAFGSVLGEPGKWDEAEVLNRRGLLDVARGQRPTAESYARIVENPFKNVAASPLSTFGMDADTASYANVRRFLREGSVPPADSVRLEELVNYFPYDYAAPRGPEPFAAHVEVADCPWNPEHRLVRVGLKARESDRRERPRANLVFLVDVSGSMQPENKLPLVQRSLRLLLDQLEAKDQVGIVTYAGEARVALEPTSVSEKPAITRVIDSLKAGSGTHGSAGIQQAYAIATNRFIKGGINRVILCTDGDFNIGLTSREDLLDLITEKAKSGVFLSVLGYGMDNYKDDTAELLADRGNGNYSYVDSFTEARKVLREEVQGTLQTVAKDAKVQVEFNPARVASWRLLGYENRLLADRDFNDDKKDAGEIGAGHTVTALYEIVPVGGRRAGVDPLRYDARAAKEKADPVPHDDELLNLKVRYKDPEGDKSRLMQVAVKDQDREAAAATADYKFAAAVVGYGMMLRDSQFKGDLTWDKVLKLAEEGLGPDREGYRAEFIDLVRRARQLRGQ